MKRFLLAAILAVSAPQVATAPASAQGFEHRFLMRGHIVDVTDGVVTVCVGRADGAAPGQVLDVQRVVPVSQPPKSTGPMFRREQVGHVRIDSIVDDHFARATVIHGAAAPHDIVELVRPASAK